MKNKIIQILIDFCEIERITNEEKANEARINSQEDTENYYHGKTDAYTEIIDKIIELT